MITEEDFNYIGALKIDVGDECIKCIWLEESKETGLDSESVMLTEGCNALIVFENGKKMIITNSEWCSLNWV